MPEPQGIALSLSNRRAVFKNDPAYDKLLLALRDEQPEALQDDEIAHLQTLSGPQNAPDPYQSTMERLLTPGRGSNLKRSVEDRVFAPVVQGAASVIEALDQRPEGLPEGAPYTTPLRMVSAAAAALPAGVGVLSDVLRGVPTPTGAGVMDPLRAPEDQATFQGEVATRGGGGLAQTMGMMADLFVDLPGMQVLGAAAPVLGAARFGKAAKTAKTSRVWKAAHDATLLQGGVTIQPHTGKMLVPGKSEGFMAGMFANQSEKTQIVPKSEFTPQVVKDFYLKNAKQFESPDRYLGIWESKGNIYLDVTKQFDDPRAATKMAELQKQPASVVRDPITGKWPPPQEKIYDLKAATERPVGNFDEWSQSPEMQARLDTLLESGKSVMNGKDWWDLYGGPLEEIYGKERVRPLAGFLAATSPASTPEQNLRSASEYLRRLIKDEDIIQPEFRIPEDAVGFKTGYNSPGKQMPMEQSRVNNLRKAATGRGSEMQQDKVNDMFHALTGMDVGVYDRRYAYAFENPEIGAYPEIGSDKLGNSMVSQVPSSYSSIENMMRTGAKKYGMPLQRYTAYVWEGIGNTIKSTGQLFGVKHVAGAIPPSSGGFNNIFPAMMQEKADHLKISLAEMKRRLRAGDAELLGAVLATPVGAEAYRQWQANSQRPDE